LEHAEIVVYEVVHEWVLGDALVDAGHGVVYFGC
jgi:hypothetical protein